MKRRKKINTIKLIIYVILLGMITAIIMSRTFAKYTTRSIGDGNAYIAKWSFKVNGLKEETIVKNNFLTEQILEERIAPGTEGKFFVEIDATGCEVALEYIIEIFNVENKPNNLKFYYDSSYTQEAQRKLESEKEVYFIKGEMLLPEIESSPKKEIAIYWKWNYETAEGDKIDTDEGTTALNMKFDIKVVGIQMNTRNKYDITYDSNGGDYIYVVQEKLEDEDIKILDVIPERTGYEFVGWSENNSATDANYVAGQDFNSNIDTTLYAVWKPKKYTVTYDYLTNGGSDVAESTQEFEYKSLVDLTPNAKKDGYTCIGWSISPTTPGVISQLKMPASDITLYAVYEKEIKATFKYYSNEVIVSDKVYNNDTEIRISVPSIPKTAENYQFNGWATTDSVEANANDFDNLSLSNSTTYYAKYVSTITIEYNANGGNGNAPTSSTQTAYMNYKGIKSEVKFVMPTNTFEKLGAIFSGWNENSAGTGTNYLVGTEYTFTESKTLYANWLVVTEVAPYNMSNYATNVGEVYYFVVDGSKTGSLWGTYVYTADSSLSSAALQLGILSGPEDSKIVGVKVIEGQVDYEGSTINGITSSSYSSYGASYVFLDKNGEEVKAPEIQISIETYDDTIKVYSTAKTYNETTIDTFYYKIDSGEYVQGGNTYEFENVSPYINHTITAKVKDSAGKEAITKVTDARIEKDLPIPTYEFLDDPVYLEEEYVYVVGSELKINYYTTMTNLYGKYMIEYEDGTTSSWYVTRQSTITIDLQKSGTYYFKITDDTGKESQIVSVEISVKYFETPTDMTSYRGNIGEVYYFVVTGKTSGGNVWGTDIYTDDSNIAMAAVHAGVVASGENKVVKIRVLEGQSSYTGSVRNGVSTSKYGSWYGSYEFVE